MTAERYDYLRPGSLDEAFRLAADGPRTRFVGGGTDVYVQFCARPAERPDVLISLRSIPELAGIEAGDTFRIGAMTTVRDIADHEDVRNTFPALARAAGGLGTPQIRNVATIGGNLCNASPCADLPPPLLVYGARAEIRGPAGTREIPLEDLFVEPGRTCLARDELLAAVLLERQPAGTRAVYQRHGRVQVDLSLASAAVAIRLDGDTCVAARIAAGAVAPTPLRLRDAEAVLVGSTLDAETIARVREAAAAAVEPITDMRAGADYRRHLVGVFVARALRRILAGECDRTCLPHRVTAPAPAAGRGDDLRGVRRVAFELNGNAVEVEVAPGARLVDVLRGPLGRTGTKEGCGHGECGACTVIVDGRTVNACLYPAIEIGGRVATTIEGIEGSEDGLSTLQRAFVDGGGIQCGFCTPGMILSAKALLDGDPDPPPDRIARAIAGNLCRCTGYVQIIESIRHAASGAGSAR